MPELQQTTAVGIIFSRVALNEIQRPRCDRLVFAPGEDSGQNLVAEMENGYQVLVPANPALRDCFIHDGTYLKFQKEYSSCHKIFRVQRCNNAPYQRLLGVRT